jgi:sugar phosphate isomerase/epimerase
MKPEIGFIGLLSTEDILDDLDFTIKNEFDCFEIALDWRQNYSLSPNVIKRIRDMSIDHGINLIVHTPYYLPTSTMLPEIQRGVMKNLKKAIGLAVDVESNKVTIHPGFIEMPSPAIKYCYDALIETLQEIVEIGKTYSVNICFENWPQPMLCSELKDYLYVLNSVKGLMATLDAGHANTTNTKVSEFFKETRNFIMDIHIHDNGGNDDEHKCLSEGTLNFQEFFSECKKARYFGPFILELFPYETILEGKKRFLDFWEKS